MSKPWTYRDDIECPNCKQLAQRHTSTITSPEIWLECSNCGRIDISVEDHFKGVFPTWWIQPC